MALPAGLATVTVTGTYLKPDGGPRTGGVTFRPEPAVLTSATHGVIILGIITAKANADGEIEAELLATDDPDVTPVDWTYRVTEHWYDEPGRSYPLALPLAEPLVDLAEVAPTDPAEGEYLTVAGPQGLPGIDGASAYVLAVADGFEGTEEEWLTSLRGPAGDDGQDGTDGRSAYQVAVDEGFVGTEQQWLDSLQTDATAYTDTAVGGRLAKTANLSDLSSAASARTNLGLVGASQFDAASVTSLLATTPFYVAHRGSGGEFPEHTLVGYDASVNAGARAIEVSVNVTADNVPVCIHDQTLDRTTNGTGNVSDKPYAALRETVTVDIGASLLGAGWSNQKLPTLREVLDRLLGRVVIFLEAKSNPSVPAVQALLSQYPGAAKSVVWKAYYASNTLTWAKSNGYTVWAYVDAGTTDGQMDAVASNVDLWGVPHTMSDARIAAVVARGKPVMCWEVHRRSEVTRLTGLGVQGLMCSQLLYLSRSTPVRTADDFASKIKTPGDLGAANYDPVYALKYGAASDAYLDVLPNQAALLGSLCPTLASGYTIRWSMMWDGLPGSTQHSGIAFCKPDDSKYAFNSANATGGYHMLLRGNGDMQLYSHTAGVTSGTQLGTIATTAPTAGNWMTFELQITPTQLILTRTDVEPDVTLTVTNSTYRGGYLHVSTGSVDNLANRPHWRAISIT
ncbi:glycerophosphodiester phosphodiesterase [Streptomyces sp. NBC_01775]|uniref:glycerophosphodiester phosphodiesterase n=1 Tax=Streptomyces sp. NBC_01775 TaxID=2975939 RepID=UPI002DDB605D|nr:glycerophosphodiester phosphodiesterase [Streptomyces sp. NBC_01775]WSB74742.1 glycerophosphodiester phosphodiesterase [Streptomyces sp. NBC_01775]